MDGKDGRARGRGAGARRGRGKRERIGRERALVSHRKIAKPAPRRGLSRRLAKISEGRLAKISHTTREGSRFPPSRFASASRRPVVRSSWFAPSVSSRHAFRPVRLALVPVQTHASSSSSSSLSSRTLCARRRIHLANSGVPHSSSSPRSVASRPNSWNSTSVRNRPRDAAAAPAGGRGDPVAFAGGANRDAREPRRCRGNPGSRVASTEPKRARRTATATTNPARDSPTTAISIRRASRPRPARRRGERRGACSAPGPSSPAPTLDDDDARPTPSSRTTTPGVRMRTDATVRARRPRPMRRSNRPTGLNRPNGPSRRSPRVDVASPTPTSSPRVVRLDRDGSAIRNPPSRFPPAARRSRTGVFVASRSSRGESFSKRRRASSRRAERLRRRPRRGGAREEYSARRVQRGEEQQYHDPAGDGDRARTPRRSVRRRPCPARSSTVARPRGPAPAPAAREHAANADGPPTSSAFRSTAREPPP